MLEFIGRGLLFVGKWVAAPLIFLAVAVGAGKSAWNSVSNSASNIFKDDKDKTEQPFFENLPRDVYDNLKGLAKGTKDVAAEEIPKAWDAVKEEAPKAVDWAKEQADSLARTPEGKALSDEWNGFLKDFSEEYDKQRAKKKPVVPTYDDQYR